LVGFLNKDSDAIHNTVILVFGSIIKVEKNGSCCNN
jgi:hypothetical protein